MISILWPLWQRQKAKIKSDAESLTSLCVAGGMEKQKIGSRFEPK